MPGLPDNPMRVVLDPAVIVHEVLSPDTRPVCSAWRDGRILPVVNRPMLNHTLGFLASFGIRKDTLLTWALWLSHRDKVHILPTPPHPQSILEAYVAPCLDADVAGIVTSRPEDFAKSGAKVTTLSPETFQKLINTATNPAKRGKA